MTCASSQMSAHFCLCSNQTLPTHQIQTNNKAQVQYSQIACLTPILCTIHEITHNQHLPRPFPTQVVEAMTLLTHSLLMTFAVTAVVQGIHTSELMTYAHYHTITRHFNQGHTIELYISNEVWILRWALQAYVVCSDNFENQVVLSSLLPCTKQSSVHLHTYVHAYGHTDCKFTK